MIGSLCGRFFFRARWRGDTMSDIRAEIERVNQRFLEAFNSGDFDRLVRDVYTRDPQFLLPGVEPVEGREAVKAALEAMRGAGNRLDLRTLEAESCGENTAWEVGSYTVRSPDGALADHGKYLVVWRREGGDWRLHRDIINTSRAG